MPRALLAIALCCMLGGAAGREAAAEDAAPAREAYILGPEDILTIFVADHPELGIDAITVSRSGSITHPVWGEVYVEGISPRQLKDALEERLSADFVKDARVSVTVLQANQLLVWLLSPAGTTSTYRLGVSGRLSELLVQAGVTPEDCRRSMAVVMRRERRRVPSNDGNGAEFRLVETCLRTTIDLHDLMVAGRKEVDIPLRRNDWVQLVHRNPVRNESYVFVIGDQNIRTDAYRYTPGMTLADVFRLGRKKPKQPPYSIYFLTRRVRPGEVVSFGEWPAGEKQAAVFGDVVRSGPVELLPELTLGEAIAAAGLAPEAGSLAQFVLARRQGAKTTAQRFYMMTPSARDGYGLAEPLREGDVVFVIGCREE